MVDLDKAVGVVVFVVIVVVCLLWASMFVIPRIEALIHHNPKAEESILPGICEYKDVNSARVDFIWRREGDEENLTGLISKTMQTCFKDGAAFKMVFRQIISQNCTYNDANNMLMGDQSGLNIYVNSTPSAYPPHIVPDHSYVLRAVLAGRKSNTFKCLTQDLVTEDKEKMEGGCMLAVPSPLSCPKLGSFSQSGIFSNPETASDKCDEALEVRTWPPCAGYICTEKNEGGKYYHTIEKMDGGSLDGLPDFCVYLEDTGVV
jgi:hypothetical protein